MIAILLSSTGGCCHCGLAWMPDRVRHDKFGCHCGLDPQSRLFSFSHASSVSSSAPSTTWSPGANST
ncbi:MAG TPA: hypothetical protein VGA59_08335, partial [Ramlibacter sp.]